MHVLLLSHCSGHYNGTRQLDYDSSDGLIDVDFTIKDVSARCHFTLLGGFLASERQIVTVTRDQPFEECDTFKSICRHRVKLKIPLGQWWLLERPQHLA